MSARVEAPIGAAAQQGRLDQVAEQGQLPQADPILPRLEEKIRMARECVQYEHWEGALDLFSHITAIVRSCRDEQRR